jgi:hypothetical protein
LLHCEAISRIKHAPFYRRTIHYPGPDLPYRYRVFVDDGFGQGQLFVYVSTGIDVRGLWPGQQVRGTGFRGQFADHYELNPRQPADIHPT